jgi:hypothetical protein
MRSLQCSACGLRYRRVGCFGLNGRHGAIVRASAELATNSDTSHINCVAPQGTLFRIGVLHPDGSVCLAILKFDDATNLLYSDDRLAWIRRPEDTAKLDIWRLAAADRAEACELRARRVCFSAEMDA